MVREPQVAPEQPAPESVQLTPLFEGSFCTVAVKPVESPAWTEAEAGFTETEMGNGVVIVTGAEADLVPSEMEVAVTETVAGAGAVAGAL